MIILSYMYSPGNAEICHDCKIVQILIDPLQITQSYSFMHMYLYIANIVQIFMGSLIFFGTDHCYWSKQHLL